MSDFGVLFLASKLYPDRVCAKCGRIVRGSEYGSYVYFPCRECNNEFWSKWSRLPTVRVVDGKYIRTHEHDSLINEYHKEDYFKN